LAIEQRLRAQNPDTTSEPLTAGTLRPLETREDQNYQIRNAIFRTHARVMWTQIYYRWLNTVVPAEADL